MANRVTRWMLAGVVGVYAGTAWGQSQMQFEQGTEVPAWIAASVPDPSDPRLEQYRQHQRKRIELEREMKKIRAKYIRNVRNVEMRQIGIQKLREFTDPAAFEGLVALFMNEDKADDVRAATLDHLAAQKTEFADATLTWAAIHGPDEVYRRAAGERLFGRIGDSGDAPFMVQAVIAGALEDSDDTVVASGAKLAEVLKLYDAIPMLINAQVQGGTAARIGGGGGGSLAWILVGQQQAFVADLTPVVADAAVAFDPTLAVVTDGTILRVIDAYVVTYRMAVHESLVRLSSTGWGKSTAHLGWDNGAWQEWYRTEFQPHLARVKAEAAGPG